MKSPPREVAHEISRALGACYHGPEPSPRGHTLSCDRVAAIIEARDRDTAVVDREAIRILRDTELVAGHTDIEGGTCPDDADCTGCDARRWLMTRGVPLRRGV